jgi:hypothetical protein
VLDSAARETAVRAYRPSLLEGVHHDVDTHGDVTIPIFDTRTCHGPAMPFAFLVAPCSLDDGVAGRICSITVRGGEGQETLPVLMQAGSSGLGRIYKITVLRLHTPEKYDIPATQSEPK